MPQFRRKPTFPLLCRFCDDTCESAAVWKAHQKLDKHKKAKKALRTSSRVAQSAARAPAGTQRPAPDGAASNTPHVTVDTQPDSTSTSTTAEPLGCATSVTAESKHDASSEPASESTGRAQEKQSPPPPSSAGGRTSHLSITEEVYLPNGLGSTLGEATVGLEHLAQNDVLRRPALQIARAHGLLVAAQRKGIGIVEAIEHLSCANCVIASLFATVAVMKNSKTALLKRRRIREAAQHLRSHLQAIASGLGCPASAGLGGCSWQQQQTAPTAAAAAPAPHTEQNEVHPAVMKAFTALEKKSPGAAFTLPDHHSPHVPPPEGTGQPDVIGGILPLGLQRTRTASSVAAIRELQGTTFKCAFGDSLPEYFSVAEWNARIPFFLEVDAAAQEVMRLLNELEQLHVNQQPHQAALEAQESPNPTNETSVQAQMAALEARMEARIEARLEAKFAAKEVVAAVNVAKNAYCAALMTAFGYPMTVQGMLQVTFTTSMASGQQPADLRVNDRIVKLKRPETHASGGCPLRVALLGRAEAIGAPKLDLAAKLADALDRDSPRSYKELARSVMPVDGECPRCHNIGKCRVQDYEFFSCNNREIPPLEKKAHIIPHSAADHPQTARLLHKIDSMPRTRSSSVAEYLALPHNLFYLSSCFKPFFDSGALVFVKIGPPECQFHRVTTTEKGEAAVIDFGADIQMRHLFSHTTLSVINGLVVDFARPAKVISGGVEHYVPHVNERYLELHARAHNSNFDGPLTTHAYPPALSRAVLELCGSRYDRSSDTITTTVRAWLQHVVQNAPEIRDGSALPQR